MGIRREITPVFVSPLCLRSSSEDELEEFEDEEDEEEEDEDEEEDDDEDDDEELEEEEEDDLCLLGFLWCLSSALPKKKCYIEGLVQKRRNSSALAMELRLSCTNPSISFGPWEMWFIVILKVLSPNTCYGLSVMLIKHGQFLPR